MMHDLTRIGSAHAVERCREPLGFEAGDANFYRYCGNDPTDLTDPTGLYGEHDCPPGPDAKDQDTVVEDFKDKAGGAFDVHCFFGRYFYGELTPKAGKPLYFGRCRYDSGLNFYVLGYGKDNSLDKDKGEFTLIRWFNIGPKGESAQTRASHKEELADLLTTASKNKAWDTPDKLEKGLRDLLGGALSDIRKTGEGVNCVEYKWPEGEVWRLQTDGTWKKDEALSKSFYFEKPKE